MPRGLSPLQKWILVRAADNHASGRKVRQLCSAPFAEKLEHEEVEPWNITNAEILHGYFNLPFRKTGYENSWSEYHRQPVSLESHHGQKFNAGPAVDAARSAASRALTRLEQRGLLIARRFIFRGRTRASFRGLYVTDEGVRLAAELRQTVESVQICTPLTETPTVEGMQQCTPLTEGQTVEPRPIDLPLTVTSQD
jgi:hypothetical protein